MKSKPPRLIRRSTPATDGGRRKVIDKCPFCEGALLYFEGFSRDLSEALVNSSGDVIEASFSDEEPVQVRKWLECLNRCDESLEDTIEYAAFSDDEED